MSNFVVEEVETIGDREATERIIKEIVDRNLRRFDDHIFHTPKKQAETEAGSASKKIFSAPRFDRSRNHNAIPSP